MALAIVGLSIARSSSSCWAVRSAAMVSSLVRRCNGTPPPGDGLPNPRVFEAEPPGGDAAGAITRGEAESRRRALGVLDPDLVRLDGAWLGCGRPGRRWRGGGWREVARRRIAHR